MIGETGSVEDFNGMLCITDGICTGGARAKLREIINVESADYYAYKGLVQGLLF
jgi:hypothetical protein